MKLCLSCSAPAVEADDTVPLCEACRALRSNPRGITFQRGDAFKAMVEKVGEPADTILATMTAPGQPLESVTTHYSYSVFWSDEDQAYVGTCREFPSMSYLDPDLKKAFEGIVALVSEVSDELGIELSTTLTVDDGVSSED